MSKFKFYYDFTSQPSRAMYIILKFSGTPFESCPVALRKAEHRTDQYREKINRFPQLPCIIDKDGFKLSESIAILRYLDHDKLISKQLYPSEKKSRALVDEYLEWQHNNTRLGCGMYFHRSVIDPMLGLERKPEEIKEFKDLMERTLNSIEKVWLKNQKFLCGNTLTVADLFAACEMEQTYTAGYDPTENRPKLKEWLKDVKESSNPHYDEAHAIVHKWAANVRKNAKL